MRRDLDRARGARAGRGAFRRALALLAALAASALLAGPAAAQMREFTGRIDSVNATTLIVDNRMGDKVSFVRIDATKVSGAKSSWESLAKSDWVSVSWKFVDKPRKAYRVRVLPPRRDED